MKRFLLLAVATIFLFLQVAVGTASAIELDQETRTVPLNEEGQTTVLSLEQVKKGRFLFNDSCAQCHLGGRTKTNPNVTLSSRDLAGAYPRRDNVVALVDYMKNPTTYDGEFEIYELHPSTRSADLFPEMRNLTEEDLKAIAGHILLQENIRPESWGKGKVYD